eukprot:g38926.t1
MLLCDLQGDGLRTKTELVGHGAPYRAVRPLLSAEATVLQVLAILQRTGPALAAPPTGSARSEPPGRAAAAAAERREAQVLSGAARAVGAGRGSAGPAMGQPAAPLADPQQPSPRSASDTCGRGKSRVLDSRLR